MSISMFWRLIKMLFWAKRQPAASRSAVFQGSCRILYKKHFLTGCCFPYGFRGVALDSVDTLASLSLGRFSQTELKTLIGKWKTAAKTKQELALLMENAGQALNHSPRRSLSGKNTCRVYFSSDRLLYNKRKRKQAWDWIRDLLAKISVK